MKAPNLGGIVLALVCQLLSQPAAALVIADSSLQLSGLSITPASGSVVFDAGSPTAQVFAQAANSLGDLDAQSPFNFPPPDAISAAASVTWAQAMADADATSLTASAASSVNLPGFDNAASSQGRGSLFGTFTLTGGEGPVNVMFSMDVTVKLHGFADAVGVIDDLELVASLEVDGSSVLFDHFTLQGGLYPMSETLTATLPLEFGVPYFLFVEADSETFAHNIPEPGTLALTLLGVAGLTRTQRASAARALQVPRRA